MFLAIAAAMLLLSAGMASGKEIDLVKLQKQEAERRKNSAVSKIFLNDDNLYSQSVVKGKCHFTWFEIEAPGFENGEHPAQSDSANASYEPVSDGDDRRSKERELEREIAEAQANIDHDEQQRRTLEQDVHSLAIPDKEGYIREKEAELQRRIEGERYFIYLTKKRLKELR